MKRYLLVLMLALPGCAQPIPDLTPTDLTQLAAHEWVLASNPEITLVYTLTEGEGRISGSTGCNQYSGPLKPGIEHAVKIGSIVATRRACVEEARNKAETEFLHLIALATAIDVGEKHLRFTLTGEDGKTGTLEFVPKSLNK